MRLLEAAATYRSRRQRRPVPRTPFRGERAGGAGSFDARVAFRPIPVHLQQPSPHPIPRRTFRRPACTVDRASTLDLQRLPLGPRIVTALAPLCVPD
jgi:hypothetical protein